MKNKIIVYPVAVAFSLSLSWSCKKKDTPPEPEKTYRFSETMTVDGRDRTYTLNLPPNYYSASDFSLVIAMHGGGGMPPSLNPLRNLPKRLTPQDL